MLIPDIDMTAHTTLFIAVRLIFLPNFSLLLFPGLFLYYLAANLDQSRLGKLFVFNVCLKILP